MGNPSFAKHLINQADYEGMINLTGFLDQDLSEQQLDSIEFYTAWSHFHLQQIGPAIKHFQQVSSSSNFYFQSRIFSSWCNLYNGDTTQAFQDLAPLRTDGQQLQGIAPFQLAAIQLYQKQFEPARNSLMQLRKSHSRYETQIDQLNQILQRGEEYRPKSMGLAALFSALLPGSGKVYAGETGAGISSFLILAGLGGVAAENIFKSGIMSWNSILFTSLLGVFYIGNIYGSMVSIQTYRNRFNETYQQGILATVVVPLRDYYR